MVYMLVLEASAERIVSSSLTWRTKTLPNTRSIIGQVVCFQFLSSAVERLVDIQEVTGSTPVETTKHHAFVAELV